MDDRQMHIAWVNETVQELEEMQRVLAAPPTPKGWEQYKQRKARKARIPVRLLGFELQIISTRRK